jgi:FixJ family two-component response regulator
VAKGRATERETVLSENISVCVVDDDESVRLSIGALIRSLGYTAHGLPGLSGIELQRALIERGRAPPTIFITAFPQDRIRRQAMAAGALSFLSKPCDDDVLVRTIEEAVSAGN